MLPGLKVYFTAQPMIRGSAYTFPRPFGDSLVVLRRGAEDKLLQRKLAGCRGWAAQV